MSYIEKMVQDVDLDSNGEISSSVPCKGGREERASCDVGARFRLVLGCSKAPCSRILHKRASNSGFDEFCKMMEKDSAGILSAAAQSEDRSLPEV